MRLVIGNFKMNLSLDEINDYIDFFKDKKFDNVIFGPSSIYLNKFIENGLTVTSQDASFASNGAYTGDISASQLKSLGVNYSIIGHSERRAYYSDSKYVNDKLNRLIENDINPIICIGETKEEKDDGKTLDVLKKEIDEAFVNIDTNLLKNVIIAYEPIWSIGTGLIPTSEDIDTTIKYIKSYIKNEYGLELKVLYGGSVSNKNIEELENIGIIDGYLVGGCSIKKEEFEKLIRTVC